MCFELDVLFQQVPSQEGERELPQTSFDEEEVDGVDDLRFGDVDIRHAEILLEAVAQELASQIQEDPELFIGHFERHQVVLGKSWV